MADDLYEAALEYHTLNGKPGKLEIQPTKPCATQRDLSLAYSPGVAEPCRRIADNPEDAFRYTNKGNLVAVITNGTAVLGLGNIGSLAGKPVMEGKAVLFKKFADIDVFDIELDVTDPEKFVDTVAAMAPTFGGINLEDIKAPECFYIETELKKRLDIPVFHDDQHGTAIISAAAFLNACELTGRDPKDVRCVFNGAGAAGLSVAKLFIKLGVDPKHALVCDRTGVIHSGRDDLGPEKVEFAQETDRRTLADAVRDADCFIGCSVGNVFTADMLKSMAANPIVFAMANPTPEIDPELARATRDDVIMATGRSDFPNQVNNVLGFPFIFRGALDASAKEINSDMILAAVHALAKLAKEPVPQVVSRAYGGDEFEYGREYLIPKPFDPRVLYWVSVAVAEAAIHSGVARRDLDLTAYRERLRATVEAGRSLVAVPLQRARGSRMRVAIPEGHLPRLIHVAQRTIQEGIAVPVLIGNPTQIREAMSEYDESDYEVYDPEDTSRDAQFVEIQRKQRPIDTPNNETLLSHLRNPFTYATLLTEAGMCDGLLAASNRPYAQMVAPILRYATRRAGVSRIVGMHLLQLKDRQLFIADTTLNTDPSAEELAETAMRAARVVRRLDIEPRVAFVSYANLSTRHDPDIARLRRAWRLVRQVEPDLECFRDVQADVALDPGRFKDIFGDQILDKPANILIFPNLHAANAAFRLARVIGSGSAIGPMLLGLRRPANVLPRGSTEDEIMTMMAITAYNALRRKREIDQNHHTRVWRPGTRTIQVIEGEDGIR